MNTPVIFPARSSIERGNSSGELFEIFSKEEEQPLSDGYMGKVRVGGNLWYHYTSPLSVDLYRELISRNGSLGKEGANYLAASVFSRLKREKVKPLVMGIINATPDSFYPASRVDGKSVKDIDAIMEQKPDIIDVGGESTRPGSRRLDVQEEIDRLRPVLEYLSSSYSVPISVDTRNPETAEFSLKYGIRYLNDISGFADPVMISVAEENSLDSILMHMRGDPATMQKDTHYDDLVFELNLFFMERASIMVERGVHPSRIIADPGIGFGKSLQGNLEIIRELKSINTGFRILGGSSRKTFIGKLTGEPPEGRLAGTIATTISLMENGADIVRVHDVRENSQALDVYLAILSGK